jgi:ubiquinone/menaquinone biosynthesis C-methylase UbiE
VQEADYEAKRRYRGDVASGYLEARESDVKWRREQALVKDLVNRYMKEGDSVLDVPFGTGRFASYYLERGLRVNGLDISEDMLAEARQQLGPRASSVNLVTGDAEALPFAAGSVDHLVCARLLNWVPLSTVDRLLGEFSRVTRSNIIVEIRTRNPAGVASRRKKTLKNGPLVLAKLLAGDLSKKLRNALSRLGKEKGQNALVFHRRDAVDSLFSKHGLNIIEEVTVEEDDSKLMWIRKPLQFYVLTAGPSTGQ